MQRELVTFSLYIFLLIIFIFLSRNFSASLSYQSTHQTVEIILSVMGNIDTEIANSVFHSRTTH